MTETSIDPIEVASGVFILEGLQHDKSAVDMDQLRDVVADLRTRSDLAPLIFVLIQEDISERAKQDIIKCGTHIVDRDVMPISDALGKGAFPAALTLLVGSHAANRILSIEGRGAQARMMADLKVEAYIDDQTYDLHADGRRGFDDDVYRTWLSRLRSESSL